MGLPISDMVIHLADMRYDCEGQACFQSKPSSRCFCICTSGTEHLLFCLCSSHNCLPLSEHSIYTLFNDLTKCVARTNFGFWACNAVLISQYIEFSFYGGKGRADKAGKCRFNKEVVGYFSK